MFKRVAVAAAMFMAIPTTAHAEVQHDDFEGNYHNPCTNESVYLVGRQTYDTRESNGYLSFRYSLHATGETPDGVKYVANEHYKAKDLPRGGGFVRLRYTLNRAGDVRNDDLVSVFVVEFKQNSDGEWIIKRERTAFNQCR